MGRKNTLTVGTSFKGFTVASNTSKYSGTNRLIQVSCDTCGTLRECWNTGFRSGKLSCSNCAGTLTKQVQGETIYPFIVVHSTHLDIIYPPDRPPATGNIFLCVSATAAMPWKPTAIQEVTPDTIPEPDTGYPYHMVVPAEWVDYYCDIADLPENFAAKALEYYEQNVVFPTAYAYSVNVKGSGTTWVINDQRYAYIYWRDHNTWPKTYPAPVQPVKTVTPTPVTPDDYEFPPSLAHDPIRKDYIPSTPDPSSQVPE